MLSADCFMTNIVRSSVFRLFHGPTSWRSFRHPFKKANADETQVSFKDLAYNMSHLYGLYLTLVSHTYYTRISNRSHIKQITYQTDHISHPYITQCLCPIPADTETKINTNMFTGLWELEV